MLRRFLVVITVILTALGFAQDPSIPYAQPAQIEFRIPMVVKHWSIEKPRIQKNERDPLENNNEILHQTLFFPLTGDFIQNKHEGNRTTLYNKETQTGAEKRISFTLDTINHELKDVLVYYKRGYLPGYYQLDSFLLSSIPYTIGWNHHLFVYLEGKELCSKLSNIYYYRMWLTNNTGSITEDYYEYLGLSTDTAAATIYMDISSTDPLYDVTESNKVTGFTTSTTSGITTFKFPPSSHLRQLIIFDILGRLIYQGSIPEGTAEFTYRERFALPGCYFASLEKQHIKFYIH